MRILSRLFGSKKSDGFKKEAIHITEDSQSVEHLTSALEDDDWSVRNRAVSSLGELRAIEHVIAALNDEHHNVRATAVKYLMSCELRDPRAIEPLTIALKDPHKLVRDGAKLALDLNYPNWQDSNKKEDIKEAIPITENLQSIEHLTSALKDNDNWGIRWNVAIKIAKLKAIDKTPLIIKEVIKKNLGLIDLADNDKYVFYTVSDKKIKLLNNGMVIVDKNDKDYLYLYEVDKYILIENLIEKVHGDALFINRHGVIAGQGYNQSGDKEFGFFYDNGSLETIQYPGSPWTHLTGISDNGTIIGNHHFPQHGGGGLDRKGFIYRNGDFEDINVPGFTRAYASAINSNDVFVGTCNDQSKYDYRGYIYDGGRYIIIDFEDVKDINDKNQVIGSIDKENEHSVGFLYQNGSISEIEIPGILKTLPTQINNEGLIMGNYRTFEGDIKEFLALPK